jgi:hypothetical protein
MSTSYSIFIKTPYSLAEVKSCLEKILNCSMEQSPHTEDEFYYVRLLGLGINLDGDLTYEGELTYKDDILPFSQYNYEIGFDYIPRFYLRDYRHDWTIMFSTVVADMVSMNLHCECVVVRNMAVVLNRFTPGEQIFMPYTETENDSVN